MLHVLPLQVAELMARAPAARHRVGVARFSVWCGMIDDGVLRLVGVAGGVADTVSVRAADTLPACRCVASAELAFGKAGLSVIARCRGRARRGGWRETREDGIASKTQFVASKSSKFFWPAGAVLRGLDGRRPEKPR